MSDRADESPRLAGGVEAGLLWVFPAIALPTGWLFLSVPIALGLPAAPFVLAAQFLALLLPALWLTWRAYGGDGVRRLLRDAVRPARPLRWLPFAGLALPTVVWLVGFSIGYHEPLSGGLVLSFTIQLVSFALVINIWEEVAWAGFYQRHAIAHWGLGRAGLITAALFAGIHLPLAFESAEGVGDVLLGILVLGGTSVGLRFLIAGVDVWSGHSLFTVGVLHAAFNASAELIQPEADWIRWSATTVMGLLAYLALRYTGRAAE